MLTTVQNLKTAENSKYSLKIDNNVPPWGSSENRPAYIKINCPPGVAFKNCRASCKNLPVYTYTYTQNATPHMETEK